VSEKRGKRPGNLLSLYGSGTKKKKTELNRTVILGDIIRVDRSSRLLQTRTPDTRGEEPGKERTRMGGKTNRFVVSGHSATLPAPSALKRRD